MLLTTISGEHVKLGNFVVKSQKSGKETEIGELELANNEQHGRMIVLLSGLASILLINVTAVLIVFSFGIGGDLKSHNYFYKQEKGKVFI